MELSYLAFPDGGLSYSCPSCGRCCKGYGFGGSLTDVALLQEERPYLIPMTHFKAFSPQLTTMFNVGSGCFMLTEHGCQLETKRCHTSKPLVCNLFPFTEFYLVGDMPVLVPQLKCCLTAAKNSSCSAHKEVMKWLKHQDLTTFRPTNLDLPYHVMGVSWVRGEAYIRDTLPPNGALTNFSALLDYCFHLPHSVVPLAENPLVLWADCLRFDVADLDKLFSQQLIDTFIKLIPTLRVHGLKSGLDYAQMGSWLAGLALLTALYRSPEADPVTLALDLDDILKREGALLKLLPMMLWPVVLPQRAEQHPLYQLWNSQQDAPFGEIIRKYLADVNGFSGIYLRSIAAIL